MKLEVARLAVCVPIVHCERLSVGSVAVHVGCRSGSRARFGVDEWVTAVRAEEVQLVVRLLAAHGWVVDRDVRLVHDGRLAVRAADREQLKARDKMVSMERRAVWQQSRKERQHLVVVDMAVRLAVLGEEFEMLQLDGAMRALKAVRMPALAHSIDRSPVQNGSIAARARKGIALAAAGGRRGHGHRARRERDPFIRRHLRRLEEVGRRRFR